VTPDDVMFGAGALVSVFIKSPEFQGQTKDRLSNSEAARLVETAPAHPRMRPSFSNGRLNAQMSASNAARQETSNANLRQKNSAFPASSPIAHVRAVTIQKSSSSRATLRVALPNKRARAKRKPSCRSKVKS